MTNSTKILSEFNLESGNEEKRSNPTIADLPLPVYKAGVKVLTMSTTTPVETATNTSSNANNIDDAMQTLDNSLRSLEEF